MTKTKKDNKMLKLTFAIMSILVVNQVPKVIPHFYCYLGASKFRLLSWNILSYGLALYPFIN